MPAAIAATDRELDQPAAARHFLAAQVPGPQYARRSMLGLGDVTYCLDCDRARSSRVEAAAAGSTQVHGEVPRRMATKKDANGDPLCASCLDARQAKRRAEYVLLHEARASAAVAQPSVASSPRKPARQKVEFVPVVREASRRSARVPSAPRQRAMRRARARKPAASSRAVERKFALLLIEVGFVRAQELLDALRRDARRARRTKGPAVDR